MKKLLTLLLAVMMVVSVISVCYAEDLEVLTEFGDADYDENADTVALAQGETHTITLVYQMAGYADETFEAKDGAKLSRALNGNVFKEASRYVYGADFVDWYVDAACTELYDKKMLVKDDLTLYACWQPWDEERQAMMDAWLAEMDRAKQPLNDKPMYTEESFEPYFKKLFMKWGSASKASWEEVENLKALQASLVPVCERDEVVWDIWGESIPQEDTTGYSFYLLQDTADFRPCLDAFLLPDQSAVKGNIVICSGGGFEHRSNDSEGYPTARHMNALGYNCFVLQYRTKPYQQIDALLDLQRAIRYIRYHAEDRGIAATDKMATIGFSAGGFVVCGQVAQCYGDILPTAFYPDYVCDEIDKVNSDVTVAAPIYGLDSECLLNSANPNMPAMFMAVGTKDSMMKGYTEGFLAVQKITPAELHVYDGVPHAFGMTDRYAGADQIDEQFDAFLTVYFGLGNRNISNN